MDRFPSHRRPIEEPKNTAWRLHRRRLNRVWSNRPWGFCYGIWWSFHPETPMISLIFTDNLDVFQESERENRSTFWTSKRVPAFSSFISGVDKCEIQGWKIRDFNPKITWTFHDFQHCLEPKDAQRPHIKTHTSKGSDLVPICVTSKVGATPMTWETFLVGCFNPSETYIPSGYD